MKIFTKTVVIFLTVMALVHILRLVEGWTVQIGSVIVPLWASGIFLAFDGILVWGLWKESR